jgi:tripartite-type tricarboxylate transporter receptor subunit TctC
VTKPTTRRSLGCLLIAVVLAGLAGCGGPAPYPSRPLTMIVPWGAGGGTDAVARMIASLMEQDLGQPVNVVNRTGGSGVVGHQAIADATPDGYTLGIITTEIAMLRHQGLTTLTSAAFAPLGLVNYDATGIEVRADAPWMTLADLMDTIRKNPGQVKASGTAQGGIWHVSLYGLLHEQGIPPTAVPWVPSNSSAAGLLDLLAGGVDLVPVSHPEARSLIDAGKVRSLAILDDAPSSLYPDVPTGRQAIGTAWKMGVWRGFGVPKGLPQDIEVRLRASLKKAYDSPAYQEFSRSRGFGLRWAGPEEFGAFMATADTQMASVMRDIGLGK